MTQANDLWVAAAGRMTMEDVEGWLMPWLDAHDAEIRAERVAPNRDAEEGKR